MFSDTLGLEIDTTLSSYAAVYLAVIVYDVELSPREQLLSVSYALTVANKSITPTKLSDGTSAGQVLEWNGTIWQLKPNESNGELKAASSSYQFYKPYHSW